MKGRRCCRWLRDAVLFARVEVRRRWWWEARGKFEFGGGKDDDCF